jgi:hypothetical protein
MYTDSLACTLGRAYRINVQTTSRDYLYPSTRHDISSLERTLKNSVSQTTLEYSDFIFRLSQPGAAAGE